MDLSVTTCIGARASADGDLARDARWRVHAWRLALFHAETCWAEVPRFLPWAPAEVVDELPASSAPAGASEGDVVGMRPDALARVAGLVRSAREARERLPWPPAGTS